MTALVPDWAARSGPVAAGSSWFACPADGCPERVSTTNPNYLAMPDWCQMHRAKIDVPVEPGR